MNRAGGARPVTAMIGAGRLARALAPRLIAAGYPLRAVLARRVAAARRVTRGTSALATTRPERAVEGAGLVLVAVPDRAIPEVAERLAGFGDWKGRVALHHAGALGPDALRPLARGGAAVGVLHPLQCLGDPERAAGALAGSRARIEGDPRAVAAARRLARALGLVPLRLPARLTPARRAAYHAAASLAANDLVGLLGIAVTLMERAGLSRREGLAALVPLARGTLDQLEGARFAPALTGPAVRGDAATLERHFAQLRRTGRHGAEVHRLLSEALLDLAASEGLPVDPEVRRRLRRN